MRRALGGLLVLAAIGAAGFWYLTAPQTLTTDELPAHTPDTENGALVFAAGGCVSCHAAPGASDEAKLVLAGGLELKTPFGVFVAPNISPDPEQGIGGWSDAAFVTAMMKGTAPDGRHYYPAFPYTSYARMEVADVLDLHAYLKTLPASDHQAADHRLGFPYSIRRGLGLWKWLNLSPDPVMPVSDDPVIARGQALVEGAGHCAECHTPRDAFGGLQMDRWLAGGPNPDGPGKIPNITPDTSGIGGWIESDIAYYLQTGFTPEFDSAGGSMAAVIRNTSQLTPEDRAAMAAYLRSVPPVASEN